MRMINVQYIPLNKIKPDLSVKMTQNMKKLRELMTDCMNIVAVKKVKKGEQYVIISGYDRYEYLKKHTTKKYIPCVVDESKISKAIKAIIHRFPDIQPDQLAPSSLKIIKSFLKRDPRFSKLPYNQQLKVLLLAVRYKRTVISAMKAKVEELSSK